MYASPAIKAQSLDGFNDSFQLVPPKCPGAVAKPLRMAPWVSLKMGGSTSQNRLYIVQTTLKIDDSKITKQDNIGPGPI